MSAHPLVEFIVHNLVEHPEEINLKEIPGEDETILELRVADADIGKVIGKNGSVARAMRTLIQAVGARDQKNYHLEIID